jgi:hypothetical protein
VVEGRDALWGIHMRNGSRRKTKHMDSTRFFALATSAASRAVSCEVTEMRVRDSAVCYRNVLLQWRFEIVEAASWKREETRGSIEVLV